MIRSLRNMIYKKSPKELALLVWKRENRGGGTCSVFKYLMDGYKEDDDSIFSVLQETLQEAMLLNILLKS